MGAAQQTTQKVANKTVSNVSVPPINDLERAKGYADFARKLVVGFTRTNSKEVGSQLAANDAKETSLHTLRVHFQAAVNSSNPEEQLKTLFQRCNKGFWDSIGKDQRDYSSLVDNIGSITITMRGEEPFEVTDGKSLALYNLANYAGALSKAAKEGATQGWRNPSRQSRSN